jgi:hypothetical protein
MRLYSRPLKNYANINQFGYSSEWNIRQGEENILYFQVVDLDQEMLRYLSSDGAFTVNVIFPQAGANGNDLSKAAVQVSALDRSVLSVSLSATEVPRSGNVRFEITENGTTKRWTLLQGMVVEKINQGGC